jgi:hypothetical protein
MGVCEGIRKGGNKKIPWVRGDCLGYSIVCAGVIGNSSCNHLSDGQVRCTGVSWE